MTYPKCDEQIFNEVGGALQAILAFSHKKLSLPVGTRFIASVIYQWMFQVKTEIPNDKSQTR